MSAVEVCSDVLRIVTEGQAKGGRALLFWLCMTYFSDKTLGKAVEGRTDVNSAHLLRFYSIRVIWGKGCEVSWLLTHKVRKQGEMNSGTQPAFFSPGSQPVECCSLYSG